MRSNRTSSYLERRSATSRCRSFMPAVIALALFVMCPALSAAQVASLSGRILDESGLAIASAQVTLDIGTSPRVALTDSAGVYQFAGVAPGTHQLRAQRIGYRPIERIVQLGAGLGTSIDIVLIGDPFILEGIVVAGTRGSERDRLRFDTDPGVTAHIVEASSIRLLPGFGEPDILRAVSLLPGVISTSDFSSSYNVRGGSSDQNLILIDGFTVFNPFHLGGLFSVFNSDAVNQAELFAGGFSAEFGGRVSSVLYIESRNDVPEHVQVIGGVSMLASRALVHVPIRGRLGRMLGGDAGNIHFSARRSYFDQLMRPIAEFPYHLVDLQAHAGLQTQGGGRLSFTAYSGQDVLDLSNLGSSDSDSDSDPEAEEADDDVLRIRWNWGNQVLGTHLLQPFRGWMLDTRLGFSRFADRLGFTDFDDVRFESRMEQLLWRGDVGRDLTSTVSLKTGVAIERLEHRNLIEGGGTTFFDAKGDGVLAATYASVRWRPTSQWIIEPGIRFDRWSSTDTTRSVLSPRFAAKRFLGTAQNTAVKLAVGRYSQFLHSLRDEELPVSNDTWVLAGRAVPAVISDQVQMGIETFWGNGWSGSIEAYARSFEGVVEFNVAEDPNDAFDDLLIGEGRSRGIDFQLRRTTGSLTGWTAISLLKARRSFPDPLAAGWEDLPQTVEYPPIFDRRINIDLVLQYAAPAGAELGVRWNYGSGLPYTRPIAQHLAWRQNPVLGRAEPFELGLESQDVPVGVILGPRNSERYPAYHRLDLTVRRTFQRRWGTFTPYLQILNVYNQRNVLFYFYNYDRTPPVRSGFSMFPFLPAIGIEANF
jgi:hypothetical protein